MACRPTLHGLWLLAAMLWTTTAHAVPFGWRYDGTAVSAGRGPLTLDGHLAWTLPLASTGNASPVLGGNQVCATMEPTTLFCADAASGRLQWKATNQWVDTLSGTAKTDGQAKLAAADAAAAELATTQAAYSATQRQARATGDAALYAKLTELSTKMAQLRATVDGMKPYRTPSDRQIIGYASATPVHDGSYLYALFGNGVVSKFSTSGARQWSVWLGNEPAPMRGFQIGTTASPLLVGGTLVVPYDRLRGLDPATGRVRWTSVPYRDYGTPAVIGELLALPNGQIISARDGRVISTGHGDVWYSSPVAKDGMFYWVGSRTDAHAAVGGTIRAGASRVSGGSVSPAWAVSVSVGERFYASPLVHQGYLYAISKDRTLVVLRASDGAIYYTQSLRGTLLGETWTSPVAAGEAIYIVSDLGEVLTLAPGGAYRMLGKSRATNALGSPVFSSSTMFLRTFKSLNAYR